MTDDQHKPDLILISRVFYRNLPATLAGVIIFCFAFIIHDFIKKKPCVFVGTSDDNSFKGSLNNYCFVLQLFGFYMHVILRAVKISR